MLPVLRTRSFATPDPWDWIDREVGRVARSFFGEGAENGVSVSYPMDVWEDDQNVYVDAELPGFKKDEINVTLEDGVLQIAAERSTEEKKNGTQLLHERRHLRSFRSFRLPTSLEEDKVVATFDDGVLHLRMPKRPEVRPRRITVK